MQTGNKISGLSKGLLILAAVLFVGTIFLPIWKIDLVAPQYPEGLALLIYADRLAGDVEIINGLNHYIGMATLHTENFIEFSILRYIFGFIVLCILSTALIGRKKGVYFLFAGFVAFSLLALVDFYRWNYNYGHDLDPTAAIQVPGMSYQPPLIGYKQLLNFGAYSMPNSGGWLFVAAGVLILFVVLLERNVFAKFLKQKSAPAVMLFLVGLVSIGACGNPGPRPLKLNEDACAYCKMSITEAPFAAQVTTIKGRSYVFDDLTCMVGYKKENVDVEYKHFYVADLCNSPSFIDVDHAILLQSEEFRSPMAGNIAAFANPDSASNYKTKYNATAVAWTELIR